MKTKFKIFKEVALRQSFTKASEHLFLSQPAISKAVKSLESEYKTTFFLRKGSYIQLTKEGELFLTYIDKILALHSELENHFLNLENQVIQHFKFGASSTITQYVLPKILAKLQRNAPQNTFEVKNGNTEYIEQAISNQEIDFGIIEGSNRNVLLHYEPFVKDEIVLVTNSKNSGVKSEAISLKVLSELPIVEREVGSGTREIIYTELAKYGIRKLNSSISFSSTEAIKNYLLNSNKHFALLSIHAVYKELAENKLKIIDTKEISFNRLFFFVTRQGFQSKKMDHLQKLISLNYNF